MIDPRSPLRLLWEDSTEVANGLKQLRSGKSSAPCPGSRTRHSKVAHDEQSSTQFSSFWHDWSGDPQLPWAIWPDRRRKPLLLPGSPPVLSKWATGQRRSSSWRVVDPLPIANMNKHKRTNQATFQGPCAGDHWPLNIKARAEWDHTKVPLPPLSLPRHVHQIKPQELPHSRGQGLMPIQSNQWSLQDRSKCSRAFHWRYPQRSTTSCRRRQKSIELHQGFH